MVTKIDVAKYYNVVMLYKYSLMSVGNEQLRIIELMIESIAVTINYFCYVTDMLWSH